MALTKASLVANTLNTDTLSSKTTNGDLTITGNGTGVPNLETGTKLNGTSLTDTFSTITPSGANLIINGDMRIAQRGTSFATLTSGQYTLDRWNCILSGGGAVTITQDADVPSGVGLEYSLKVDVTTADALGAAGDQYTLSYTVEGYDAAVLGFGDSGAQNMTLSFWVKSPKTGQHTVAFQNEAQNRVYLGTYTVNVADTWEYKTITVAGDTTGTWTKTNGYGLTMYWALGMGSTNGGGTAGSWGTTQKKGSTGDVNVMDSDTNNFFLTGVKLEVGSTATDFVPDDYATALAKCQRYYQIAQRSSAAGLWQSASVANLHWYFTVPMRAIPTMTILNTSLQIIECGVATRSPGTAAFSAADASEYGCNMQIGGFSSATTHNPAYLYTDDSIQAAAEL